MNWWQETILGGLAGIAIAAAVLYVGIELTEYLMEFVP